MKILDLKKQYKDLYQPSPKRIETIQVPSLPFVMLDGAIEKGSEPGASPGFAAATQALYSLCYTLKFMLKKRQDDPIDYPVMALEGLWSVRNGIFDMRIKDNWDYTLLILQPQVITNDLIEQARQEVRRKKGGSPELDSIRLAWFEEGLCVQTMHIGPYATEPDTLDRMRAYMREQGLQDNVGPHGKHHEIYLSDPRKTAPEKIKTVLRHPVLKAA